MPPTPLKQYDHPYVAWRIRLLHFIRPTGGMQYRKRGRFFFVVEMIQHLDIHISSCRVWNGPNSKSDGEDRAMGTTLSIFLIQTHMIIQYKYRKRVLGRGAAWTDLHVARVPGRVNIRPFALHDLLNGRVIPGKRYPTGYQRVVYHAHTVDVHFLCQGLRNMPAFGGRYSNNGTT